MTDNRPTGSPSGARSKLPVVLLALVFVLPLAVALLAYRTIDVSTTGTTNYGELVHPARPLEQVQLSRLDGKAFTIDDLRGKWTMVYILGSACGESCRQSVYKMRQVRWAQGEEMQRVRRLLVVMESQHLEQLKPVIAEYPGMIVVKGEPEAVERFVAQFDRSAEEPARLGQRTYIVDPIGNLMMSYPPDADPKGMLKDLKRLLHVSQIG